MPARSRSLFSSVVGAMCAASVTLAGGAVQSTFDTDVEGWTAVNDVTGFMWTDAFGNPGGSIRASDQTSGQWWFFVAPESYLGDKSSFLGAELSWDIYGIVGNQTSTNRADVILIGADFSIGINVPVEPENGAWTSWSVIVDAVEDWRIVSSVSVGSLSSEQATQADIEAVLADLQGLRLRGEYTIGADSTAIDNVRFAPPPCGDVTGDGSVDLADLNLVLSMFGMDTSNGDANGDGTVNLADLNLVLSQFGGAC